MFLLFVSLLFTTVHIFFDHVACGLRVTMMMLSSRMALRASTTHATRRVLLPAVSSCANNNVVAIRSTSTLQEKALKALLNHKQGETSSSDLKKQNGTEADQPKQKVVFVNTPSPVRFAAVTPSLQTTAPSFKSNTHDDTPKASSTNTSSVSPPPKVQQDSLLQQQQPPTTLPIYKEGLAEPPPTSPRQQTRPLLHEFAPKIVVVGVGGAGGNALNNMIAKELKGVDFLALNTDAQHLSSTLTDQRIQLGMELTQGLGKYVVYI
jgi:hypothetical protein